MDCESELDQLIQSLRFPRRTILLGSDVPLDARFNAWLAIVDASEQEVLDRLRTHCRSEVELANAYRRWQYAEMERHDREKIEAMRAVMARRSDRNQLDRNRCEERRS